MNAYLVSTEFDINTLALSLGILPGVMLFFLGYVLWRRKKLVENIPTSTVRAMALGLVEVKGKAQPFQEVYESPFTGKKCVYLEYEISEELPTRREVFDKPLAQFISLPNKFFLEDETGKVLVDPRWGELQLQKKREYIMRHNELIRALEILKIPRKNSLGGERRFYGTETCISLGDELYVMGVADNNPQVSGAAEGCDNVFIHKKGDTVFCISDQKERQVVAKLKKQSLLYFSAGFLWAIILSLLILGLWYARKQEEGVFDPQKLIDQAKRDTPSRVVKRKLGFVTNDNKL